MNPLGNNKIFAYFGHHKCASTWVHGILNQVCKRMGLNFGIVHTPDMFNKDLNSFVKNNKIDFLAYTNAHIEYVEKLPEFKGFHIIRDPRDIVVSAYFSHLYSHTTKGWDALIGHREKLKSVSKEDGLFLEMEFRNYQFKEMLNWDYSQPNVLELKMEDLIRNPYYHLIEIFNFLEILDETSHSVKKRFRLLLRDVQIRVRDQSNGLFFGKTSQKSIPVEELLGIIYRNRFSKKSAGRIPGQEDVKSHYRKGVSGDWINHFSPDHIKFFKQNYNDLILKLGYEQDQDWNSK